MTPLRSLVAGAAFVTLCTGTTAQESKPSPRPKMPVGTFGWKAPAKAVVTENVMMQGNTMRLRYGLDFAGTKTAANAVLSLRDFKVVATGGRDVARKEVRALLKPVIARTPAIPRLVINKTGEFERVDGLKKMIARLDDETRKGRPVDPEERARMDRTLAHPSFRAALSNSVALFWNTWVGSWVDWDVAPGKKRRKRTTLAIGDVKVPAVVTLQNHGAVQNQPGHYRLSVHTIAAGPRAREAMHRYMRKLVGHPVPRGAQSVPKDGMKDLRLEYHAEVITRLDTLRPVRATHSKKVTVRMEGEPQARVQQEVRTYDFDWKD